MLTTPDLSSLDTAKCSEKFSSDNHPTSNETLGQEMGQETGISAEQNVKVEHAARSMSDLTSTETEFLAETSVTETESFVQKGELADNIIHCPRGVSPETSETTSDATSERVLSSRKEAEAYDEITNSDVASLDDWENVHESCLSEIPPVDPYVLEDLEERANDIAQNLDHMLATLANALKAMSHVSSECLSAYSLCVDHASETVDVNIKSMYTLIARCEELNASMKPVQSMAEQVKDIKKTLDIFEAICK